MNYLVTTNNDKPFYTNWFEAENHFIEGCEMVVYNLSMSTYTTDGETWEKIEEDHL